MLLKLLLAIINTVFLAYDSFLGSKRPFLGRIHSVSRRSENCAASLSLPSEFASLLELPLELLIFPPQLLHALSICLGDT